MRLHLLLFLTILLALLFTPRQPAAAKTEAAPATSWAAQGEYRPGAVLVKFKPEKAGVGRAALAAEGLDVTQEIEGLGVLDVAVPAGQEAATVEQLSLRADVAYAELDYRASALLEPNDPDYLNGKQWGLAQIGAAQAWGVTTGAASVIIAVIDKGVDLTHSDLVGKLWTNTGETINGKDDDGNGCIDDVNGCHFYNAWNGTAYEPRADRFVQDGDGHGTHVAGIAAAASNNGVGIAGLSWASPIMTVKVSHDLGFIWDSDIARGIGYAAKNGARIINLSVGQAAFSETLCDAVSTANTAGKLVVAAAGNEDASVYYPAACPGALAVAATDRSDQHASFSNQGSRIDLAAPGVDIWSTWYASGLNLHTYAQKSGTSQAAPFVSGAAALVWARWPSLTAEGVKAQLLGTAADVGAPGKDDGTGWGRLDVAAAVAAPAPTVDLRLDASVAPQTVVAGNPLTATFTVTNAGSSAATSVTLHATLPAAPGPIQSGSATCSASGLDLTCGATRLDPGATITVSAVITPTTVGDGQLATTGSVSAAQQESTPADNSQTVTSSIRPVLSGRIFLDSNGDGIRQAWETRGVSGGVLFLARNLVDVAYTASQGSEGAFKFDTVEAGAYALRIEHLPDGFTLTTPAEVPLQIDPAKETAAYFGAWTGTAEPTPTPTATPEGLRSLWLPVIVR